MSLIINLKKKLYFSIKTGQQKARLYIFYKLDYFSQVYIKRVNCGKYEIIK